MANAVLMPQAGISVESCIITEWLKKPGDTVAVGDILFSYETDKASFECESTEAGTLLECFYENGDEVPVLIPVCAVGAPGEDTAALRPAGGTQAPAAPAPAPAAEPAPTVTATIANAPVAAASGDAKASPRAKRLAAKSGVDYTSAAASGPYGRIIERDVRALISLGAGASQNAATSQSVAAPPVGEPELAFTDIKFSGIRKAISRSMTQSLADIPQLTHNFSFDATAIMTYRKQVKAAGELLGLPNITLGDMVMFAVSRMLAKYPDLNAHMLDGTTIRRFQAVNLAFACDTERGLMVPVIKNADQKSLAQIAAEGKELAKQCQSGSISPDHLAGGTFTVSNLGAFGVESFSPVINPPQTGILGVDNIIERPRTAKDGGIELYPAMGLSLTYDHRAIDGAPASRFVQELCKLLESFSLLLANG